MSLPAPLPIAPEELICECGHYVWAHVTTSERRGCFPPEGCDCRNFMPITSNEPPLHWKENALRLADHHRQNCAGSGCTISLVGIAELLRLAGFELTDDELRRLL